MKENEGHVRFPKTAGHVLDARRYYRNRAIQLRSMGWRLESMVDLRAPGGLYIGVDTKWFSPENVEHRSAYILEKQKGKGKYTRWLGSATTPVVVLEECEEVRGYLDRHGVKYTLAKPPGGAAYEAIAKFYGNICASRSGVWYMNHIDEGLYLLKNMGASQTTLQAWCLHPILQDDQPLRAALETGQLAGQNVDAVLLAMEYRNWANAYLPRHTEVPHRFPSAGPLPQVREMLIADKVQNRKDFECYLKGRRDVDSARLVRYFDRWFEELGISREEYVKLASDLHFLYMDG